MRKRVYCLYRVSTKGQVEKDDIPISVLIPASHDPNVLITGIEYQIAG